MQPDHDFTVTTPSGVKINFDDRIGLPASKSGVDAFVTPYPMLVAALDGRTRGREKLDTYLHEACHILFEKMSEKHVEICAAFLADVIWSAGYRRKCERPIGKIKRKQRK